MQVTNLILLLTCRGCFYQLVIQSQKYQLIQEYCSICITDNKHMIEFIHYKYMYLPGGGVGGDRFSVADWVQLQVLKDV